MFYEVNTLDELKQAEYFVKNDYYNCPFLYANLKKYGIEKNNTKLYILMINDELQSVAFMYYECLHLYYKNTFNEKDEIISLVNKLKPRTMFFPLFNDIPEFDIQGYGKKEVLVMAPQSYLDIDISMVKNAKLSDIPRISQFMCTEWADRYESSDALCNQIQERMKDDYGRTKYIESEGEIVACVSSYAEIEDFAICGGLLISASQRGKRLGSIMLKSIYQELDNEGKKPCGIIVEDYSRIFHEKNEFAVVGKVIQYNRLER